MNRRKKNGARFEEIKVEVTLLYETFFSLLAQLTAFSSRCFEGNGQQGKNKIILGTSKQYPNESKFEITKTLSIFVMFCWYFSAATFSVTSNQREYLLKCK